MYIITNKNDRILAVGEKMYYNGSNGYPAFYGDDAFYPVDQVNMYKVNEVPENVAPFTWGYNGTEFIDFEKTANESTPPEKDPNEFILIIEEPDELVEEGLEENEEGGNE